MESSLSKEYIHMPEEDIIFQTEVLDRAHPGQVSSSVQVGSSGLTTHDLQLRKVISPSFELRFGCSWTLKKRPLSQEYIHIPEEDIRFQTKVID